ncbi:MAG: VTT domain-containing protein [Thermoproteota archaeon]|nr:VTT domain-containing protein [Thermoproteota archaeon]
MIDLVFSGIIVTKQALPETVVQILNAINNFINNPLFVEYGSLGLFINGVFSTFIPFPPELTAISLVLAGISRFDILITLVTSWIIGAALGYYAGLSSKKLADIFKNRRRETETPGEEYADHNTRALPRNDRKIRDDSISYSGHNHKMKDKSRHSRYLQLLERYGWAIIFVAPWIPVLGDIIPAIAGAKRYDFMKFMIAISAGKTVRAIVTIFLGAYIASIPVPPWL